MCMGTVGPTCITWTHRPRRLSFLNWIGDITPDSDNSVKLDDANLLVLGDRRSNNLCPIQTDLV